MATSTPVAVPRPISSAPALQVLFDQDDYQSIDLSGFVTGSGIQTLRASRVAKASNIYLVAPRGDHRCWNGGHRRVGREWSSVAPVIANAGNIQAQGGDGRNSGRCGTQYRRAHRGLEHRRRGSQNVRHANRVGQPGAGLGLHRGSGRLWRRRG